MRNRCILFCIFLFLNNSSLNAEEYINLYSARQQVLMEPLIKSFQEKTNIKVNVISAKASQLINKIESEGQYTKADILLTTDVGRLINAKRKQFFKRVDSKYLDEKIPKAFKDKDKMWFGLSLRSRILIYNPKKVKISELLGYRNLALEKWRGRILVRSSNNVYNQSLVAAMIINYGEKNIERFLKNFVKNFARKPSGGDRDQIKGIVSGQGDIALVNSYYFLKMKLNDKDNFLKNTAIHFPRDDRMKTHVNISGAGVIKYSKNYDNAVKFLEYMVTEEAQKIYADVNYEYPLNEKIKISSGISNYLIPEKDNLSLSDIGNVNEKAIILMDKAGWK